MGHPQGTGTCHHRCSVLWDLSFPGYLSPPTPPLCGPNLFLAPDPWPQNRALSILTMWYHSAADRNPSDAHAAAWGSKGHLLPRVSGPKGLFSGAHTNASRPGSPVHFQGRGSESEDGGESDTPVRPSPPSSSQPFWSLLALTSPNRGRGRLERERVLFTWKGVPVISGGSRLTPWSYEVQRAERLVSGSVQCNGKGRSSFRKHSRRPALRPRDSALKKRNKEKVPCSHEADVLDG